MNDIKSFSFYRNYYELIKYLEGEDRLDLYDAIFEYIFEDKEPTFNNLKNGIWVNLRLPLTTSKNNSGRGGRNKKEETDSKPIENRIKNRIKNRIETESKTNNIFLFLISNLFKDKRLLREKIIEWLEYKKQRKDKPYTEIGFKKLLKQIENNVNIYGEESVINLIDECMGNNYQGIIFEKLKKTKQKELPTWFDKNNPKEELTEEERKEFDDLLNI